MTIRVEREALLSVINTTSSQSSSITSRTRPSTSLSSKPCNPCIRDEDEFVIVDFYSDFIPGSNGDDDLASLCTLSTSSVSSYDSSSDASTVERRVSFASQLVTDVWTRDRTLPEDVSNLYYSALETQTFRQEYRLEKKLLSELSIDTETFPVDNEDLSNLIAATTSTNGSGNGRHRISRVCVVYNDKLETFCNPTKSSQQQPNKKESAQPSTASFRSQLKDCNNNNESIPSDFFDNDSFWSGSLTWY